MEFVVSDDVPNDMLLPSSTKTKQNVSKFSPKPGCKSEKPLNKKENSSEAPNAIEVHLGKDANVAESNAIAKVTEPRDLTSELDAGSTKLIPVKEPSMLIKETEVLSGDNLEVISDKVVKSTDSPNDVASMSIPLQNASTEVDQSGSQSPEIETSLQHDTGNVQQDLDDMLLFSSGLTIKQRNKLKLKPALCSKGHENKSVKFSLPVETKRSRSQEQGPEYLDLNMTPEPIEDDVSNCEGHAELADNDEEFEVIDEIMDIDSWDEPSVPAKMKNSRAGKPSGGSSKRNSTGRRVQNDDYTNNDSGEIGDLNESNGNDEDFETIDEIMDINSWDEPSVPTKLGNDASAKTSGGSMKKESAKRTFKKDNNGNENTTKRKRKPREELKKVKEPKRTPQVSQRKKRQADKALLEKSERGIDPSQVAIKDLILIAEAKEKSLTKEAANSMPDSNKDDGNPLDEGFDPDSEEAHRHWLKNAKKINYQTHMNISRSKRWSKEDNALFYDAVRDFKTNFAMMVWLFPGRTSRQIKAKFKAEERKHPQELGDALEYRSKDHSLFGKVIEIMKERKKEEDAATNETEEEVEMEVGHKANDSDKTDPWNDVDVDFDFDFDADADAPLTEDKVDTFHVEVDNSEKKDLWDDDFLDCHDLNFETDAASTLFEENKEEN